MEKAHWFQRINELFLGGVGGIWTLAPLFRRPTPLAGAPLRPLEYYSRAKCVTLIQKNGGESGIRTHGTLPYGSFQDCFLKPLGHLSSWAPAHAVPNAYLIYQISAALSSPKSKFPLVVRILCGATTFLREKAGFPLYWNIFLLYNKYR